MYRNSRELIREEAEISAGHVVSSVARTIEQDFLVVARATDHLSLFVQKGTWDEKDLLNEIREMVAQNPCVYGSTVAFLPFQFSERVESYAPYFYKSAEEIEFVQLGAESYDYLNKDWFRIPVRGRVPIWTAPYFDKGGGNAFMVTYARPVPGSDADDPQKHLRAIVTADIALSPINNLVNGIRPYASGFCEIFSNDGFYVTARNPELVMRRTIFDVADEHGDGKAKEMAKEIIRRQAGYYDIGPGFTDVDSYLACTRIDPPGWTVAAILPKSELFAKADDLRHKTILLAVFGIALLAIAATLVARSISRPLRFLARETVKVVEGNLDVNFSSIRSSDEAGRLARAFTKMTDGLKERERIKDAFGRYLTQQVVKRLLESKDGLKLGGEIREITLLMSDLRGFTALTSRMSPEQVIKFLNCYLGKMVEIIIEHQGMIDEIIGDGILAFFGAPERLQNHPELGLACALKMQLAMDEINALNEADGLPHLEMGIAVNTGEVVVGNIGSEQRAKYGAVDAQVNFTSRVEAFTVGGQVLVSRHTYEKIADQLEVSQVFNIEMKGVPGKVDLYNIIGIKGDHAERLKHKDKSLASLPKAITVRVFGMDQKILDTKENEATITETSLKSARIIFQHDIMLWDDLRMVIRSKDLGDQDSEIYAKVIAVTARDEGIEAIVRLTWVSTGAYRFLRHLLALPKNSSAAT